MMAENHVFSNFNQPLTPTYSSLTLLIQGTGLKFLLPNGYLAADVKWVSVFFMVYNMQFWY